VDEAVTGVITQPVRKGLELVSRDRWSGSLVRGGLIMPSGELSSRGRLPGFVLPGLVIDLDAEDRDLLQRGVAGGADLLSEQAFSGAPP
jgi:hypothetical protein